jgi:hypothetical protein
MAICCKSGTVPTAGNDEANVCLQLLFPKAHLEVEGLYASGSSMEANGPFQRVASRFP